jgi:membrane peptidoglycan carboxypeptidase
VEVSEAPCEQAVEPGLANTLLTGLSRDALPGGTAGRAAAEVGWHRPMAGKTGTTQHHQSAAFVGVVPDLSGAVITFDNSANPRPLCDGPGAADAARPAGHQRHLVGQIEHRTPPELIRGSPHSR